jgi:hypothetical protein
MKQELSDFFSNGDRPFKITVIVIASIILACAVITIVSVAFIDYRVNLWMETDAKERVAETRAAAIERANELARAHEEREQLINEAFLKFQSANPTLPVPQIVDANAAKTQQARIIVSPPVASSTPSPTAIPTIILKTKTKVRYMSRPTATPWTLFPKRK